MAVILTFSAVTALVSSLVTLYSMSGTNRFVPNACRNVGTYLPDHIVGQDLAINQLVDAVCEHLIEDRSHASGAGRSAKPAKPLLLSVHGPPGVGKTFTHTLLARALYNRDPAKAADCPGEGCHGAKVLYGMSYLEGQREGQLGAVREAVLAHLRAAPNPLLVVEEYDKLDCESRALLRQLVEHPELTNTTANRAIIMLESNQGMLELEQMLTQAGGNRSQISPEAAESLLREVVLRQLRRKPCEQLEDSLKFSATIDFFLPFLPLTRREITALMEREVVQHYGPRLGGLGAALAADPAAVAWLVDRVDFSAEGYPIEGAKQVSTVCVKHVSRLVRLLQGQLRAEGAGQGAGADKQQASAHAAAGAARQTYVLEVAPGGAELRLRKVSPG